MKILVIGSFFFSNDLYYLCNVTLNKLTATKFRLALTKIIYYIKF